jgi:hypothetical protein
MNNKTLGVAALSLTMLAAWTGEPTTAVDSATSRSAARDPVDSALWTDMRNVDLHVGKPGSPGALRVRSLRGRVIPTTPGVVPYLDEPESFRIDVTSGVVALDGTAMTTLMNERVFAYRGAPIRNLKISIENGQVIQSGIMHKGVDLPFKMWGDLSLTPDGWARIHPTKLRLLGVNGLKLMHALGLKMEKMLDVRGTNGVVRVVGDDMLIDPMRLIPPPTVTGQIASMRIEGSEIVQTFQRSADDGRFAAQLTPDSSVHNYIYYRFAQLRFGKLLMTPTDLLIGDADESDPLDLDLPRYEKQLVAGYTRTLEGGALRTWMPDLGDLGKGPLSPPIADARTRKVIGSR